MTGGLRERRLVTILFSDLSDSTGIAAGLEPELYADLLEQIRAIADRVIPAHGGDVIRIDGDGMLCIFGYPEPFEDAGRRATEAALDMHAELAALDVSFLMPCKTLHLHSGVHAGIVLLSGGDIVRGKYEVLGDTTNAAARLCDAAGPGEILVSAETLGSAHHFFEVGECRAVALAGRAAKLASWPVTGRSGVGRMYETREREGITAFQGRNAERAHVRGWLSDGAEAPRLLLVHGPAGIGKSRFLRHVTDEAKAQGWQVASAYCEAYLGARPLQPFRQIAQGLAVDMASLGGVLASAARLLLVIDDWQWADDASRDRLADLLDAVGDGVKILLASRDAEVGFRSESCFLLLPPLGRAEILVTIDSLLRSPDSFAAQRIEQASGGSPLLIEELCHAFAAGIETAGQDPRGAWFDHAVQTRFERLGADEKALLKLSAVIGHRAPVWLLDALLGQRMAPERLAQLQAADFLFADESGGLYRFKHGLTRDAVYASIGLGERRSLHGDVLLALEAGAEGREGLLDALAYHAVAAGNADKGLPYAIEAGDAALAMGALDRAQAHYRAGFDLAQAIGDETTRRAWVWSFLNKYGLACIVDPAPDQLPMLERAQALLQTNGSPREAMRSAYWLGSIAYGVGMGKRSVRHLRAALSHAQTCGTAQDVRLIATKLAHSLFASGRHTEAIAQFEALLPDLRHISRRNDRELAAYAHACFAFLNSERGDYARADRLFVEAEALLADPDSAMNASVHLYRAAALVTQGAWEQAIGTTNAVLAVSQRSRARMQDRTSRAQAAYARWQMSRDQDAVEALERAASLFLVPGNSLQHASMVFGWMVDVMAAQNDADKARLYMAEIVRRIRVGGDRLGEAMAWRALSRMAQAQGDAARADRMLGFARRSALVRLSRREAAHNLVCEAHLRRARGQGGEADQLLTTAAGEFATMGMPFFKAQASALANR